MREPNHRPAVIVDIDGTLADVRHRLHHIRGGGGRDWKAFFEAMDRDTPIESVIRWVRNLPPDYDVVVVTGRPEHYRRRTEAWLKRQAIPYSRLFMRRDGDHRPDYVAKAEFLRELPRVAFAIDDRPQVCAMWKKNGVRCFQIASDEENQQVNEMYREKS